LRKIPAQSFYLDLYTTALNPDEILVDVEIPVDDRRQVVAFDEIARRHGDYAITGIAASAQRHGEALKHPRFVFFAVANTPFQATEAEAVCHDKALTVAVIDAAVAALAAELEPIADLTSSSATKRHLAGVLLRRAIKALASTN
jgi:carbon-monoxide dehydrogenase medium subunit